MNILPSMADFAAAHDAGKNQIVWTRLVADLDTPVGLMLKLAGARKDSFILESVTGGEHRGRYSVIGMKPDLIWRCRGSEVEINRDARVDADSFSPVDADPLTSLRSVLEESRIDLPEGMPPMSAGLFGYLGYDMVRHVEHLPNINPDPLGLPDAVMIRPTVIAIVDAVKGEVIVVSPVWAEGGLNARAAYAQAAERVMDAVADFDRSPKVETALAGASDGQAEPVSNTTRAEYDGIVEKAKDYIKAGDIFQVVPSQRWSLPFDLPPFALYRSLRRTNPSPYMFFFNFGGFQVIGASPEILVQARDGKVTIRPIAGTRKRGATMEEDKALEFDLLADPKERAEHLMLLDLGRNDVGRVAKIGTVTPTETFIIERYSHVMHIVSNVEGELSEEHDALSALLAGLPAGTVSGAPKVRAMEIIDELEKEKRGVYGGGVGYFSADGEMDICIALRTAVLKDETLYVQAGGGVVYDSDPEAEYQETVNKAGALMAAARDAYRMTGRGN
ncbi:anthranilate synthase component I [Pontivivens insulae]|uniref:Anthranilate synthase component 1 n=1 Tax=Pontivivens insulae TaxID=1639689 RepID=A0A2R8AAS2_9RHOB|nr:anthranilate synthase component I [Pontivivens insulae]RED13229.1 anthranilate synthase component I [Pontivivens insulae]SPF29321.1 Anthranilate synthase component 1 [Pontivivens insulae]